MRMLVSVEFADAGTKSGTHRVLIIGRGSEGPAPGDIGLSLEEAKTLICAIQATVAGWARVEVGCSCFLPAIRSASIRRAKIAPLSKGRSSGFISSNE
jgi:hypothetical protein